MKRIRLSITLFFIGVCINAQVGIGTTNPQGVLDVVSNNSGIIVPRVTNISAIGSPKDGMIIYDKSTNCLKGFENNSWTNCYSRAENSSTVISDCETNGLEGSFVKNIGLSATFKVSIINNSFSTVTINFQKEDVVTSGVSGVNSIAVNPSSKQLAPGESQLVTYSLSGAPSSTGTLTVSWSKQSLRCVKEVEVVTAFSTSPVESFKGSSTQQFYGNSVSISDDGTRMVVGAPTTNGETGKVYTYDYNSNTNSWTATSTHTLIGDVQKSSFGHSVSLSSDGNTLAVGVPTADNTNNLNDFDGKVMLYTYSSSGWVSKGGNTAIIQGTDNSYFGYSVSLSSGGSRLAVGGWNANDPSKPIEFGEGQGVVKVYDYNGSTWNEVFVNYGELKNDQFGFSVSLSSDGNMLAVGSPGNDNGNISDSENWGLVKLFRFENNSWSYKHTYHGERIYHSFGETVSLSHDGSVLAVGSPNYDGTNGSINDNRGQVKIFDFNTNFWQSNPSSTIEGDGNSYFGCSISLSSDGKSLAAGAYNANAKTGLVRVFGPTGNKWFKVGSDLDGTINIFDGFGTSVSLTANGKTLVAGAAYFNSKKGYINIYDR